MSFFPLTNSYFSRWLKHVKTTNQIILPDHSGNEYQWEFQDPKMEVLYHIRPYFMEMFPYIRLI